jgi:hypothetical protein
MTTPSQEQLTSVDHQYFDWSTSKQQTNLHQPLMTHTNRRHHYEDKQFKSNTSPVSLSPISHIKKKQKRNGKRSNDEQNQSQVKKFSFERKMIKSPVWNFFRHAIHFKQN